MMKKKLLATLLTLSMTATTLAGATVFLRQKSTNRLNLPSGSQAVIRMTGIFPWKKNSWKSIHGSH